MKFKVLSGDLPKNATCESAFGSTVISWGRGWSKTIAIKPKVFKTVDVLDEEKKKSFLGSSAGAAVGGFLLGPVGLVAGALAAGNKKLLVVHCQLANGRSFIAEVDSAGYKALLAGL